jgi:hypothetical protein
MSWFKKTPVPTPPEEQCDHLWKAIASSYSPPRRFECSGFTPDHYVRVAMEGQTTVTQKCTRCDYVSSTRHYGHVRIPGLVPVERASGALTREGVLRIVDETLAEKGLRR